MVSTGRKICCQWLDIKYLWDLSYVSFSRARQVPLKVNQLHKEWNFKTVPQKWKTYAGDRVITQRTFLTDFDLQRAGFTGNQLPVHSHFIREPDLPVWRLTSLFRQAPPSPTHTHTKNTGGVSFTVQFMSSLSQQASVTWYNLNTA